MGATGVRRTRKKACNKCGSQTLIWYGSAWRCICHLEYIKNHKEERAAYHKRYDLAHAKERAKYFKDRSKKYHEGHTEERREYFKRLYKINRGGLPGLIRAARDRAKRRGGWCTLTLENFSDSSVCHYCGLNGFVSGDSCGVLPSSKTLDKVVPTLWYTPENTVICCFSCNMVKGKRTPDCIRALGYGWLADKVEAHITNQFKQKETSHAA